MKLLNAAMMCMISLSLLLACGDSSDDSDAAPSTSDVSTGAGSNSISGTVTYTGGDSVNKVTISTASTPVGYPLDSFIEYATPTFPLSFKLEGISDGDLYVFAILDKGEVTTGAPDSADVVITYGTAAITFSSGTTPEDITISAD